MFILSPPKLAKSVAISGEERGLDNGARGKEGKACLQIMLLVPVPIFEMEKKSLLTPLFLVAIGIMSLQLIYAQYYGDIRKL